MKSFTLSLLMLLLFSGCKKSMEKVAEDIVVKAMTDGQWKMTSFIESGNNKTGDFSAYKFQFYDNKTVDGIKNGSVEKSGTWIGDAPSMSISANFTNAVYPLTLINGTWLITNNSWTFVEAKQTTGTEVKTLRLDKL